MAQVKSYEDKLLDVWSFNGHFAVISCPLQSNRVKISRTVGRKEPVVTARLRGNMGTTTRGRWVFPYSFRRPNTPICERTGKELEHVPFPIRIRKNAEEIFYYVHNLRKGNCHAGMWRNLQPSCNRDASKRKPNAGGCRAKSSFRRG